MIAQLRIGRSGRNVERTRRPNNDVQEQVLYNYHLNALSQAG